MIRTQTAPSILKKGDEFITAASSSAINDEKALLKGIKVFEEWGLISRPHKLLGRNFGYLSGDDYTRFKELHLQKTAPLIVFAKGGWGAARLLEREQPWKIGWMVGYSDITSLLFSRLSSGFDGGIHGPLATSLSEEPEWSKDRLKAILFGETVPDLYGESWNYGIATGPVVVGNLTVLSHLIGSRHMPNMQGAILVLEDIGESPYRIDRMLTHLRLAGVLQKLSGIAFGNFNKCDDDEDIPMDQKFTAEEVLRERSKDLNIPVLAKLPIGHCCGNAAIPLGHKAILNGNKSRLSLVVD
tara:strand:+ start:943 stop:1839 length:897 start_codon:yes stop_codon:yes gene_type:complete